MKNIIKKILSLLPVKKRILLESHPDLSGNTYQVYEKLLSNKLNEKYEIVWLVENPSRYKHIKVENVLFKNYQSKSKIEFIKMVFFKATSKMYIYENKFIGKLNKKTISVFLNHGTLLKNTKGIYGPEKDVNYVISASEKISHLYAEMYGISEKIVQPLGYPRNDLLFNSSKIDWKMFFPEYKNEKIVIWMPTFRQHKSGNRKDTITELPLGIPVIYSEQQLLEMNKLLKEKNVFIVFKAHYAQNLDFIKLNNLSNFKILSDQNIFDKGRSLYSILSSTDALITDYSSIYFDYLLLDKPIALTNDDIEDYKPGFVYSDIEHVLIGEMINTIEHFNKFIENVSNNLDVKQHERQKVNDFFNKYQDGNSAERIYKFVSNLLDYKESKENIENGRY